MSEKKRTLVWNGNGGVTLAITWRSSCVALVAATPTKAYLPRTIIHKSASNVLPLLARPHLNVTGECHDSCSRLTLRSSGPAPMVNCVSRAESRGPLPAVVGRFVHLTIPGLRDRQWPHKRHPSHARASQPKKTIAAPVNLRNEEQMLATVSPRRYRAAMNNAVPTA
jgi:hypothetical protein